MSLKKEDLIQVCPNCKGEGKIYDPPRDTQNTSYGRQVGFSRTTYCSRCRNTGKILTEEGEAVLSVVELAQRQNRIN